MRVLACALFLSAVAAAEGKKTTAEWVGPDELKITSRVEFYGRVLKSQINAWEKGIEACWNRDAWAEVTQDGKTRRVKLVFDLKARLRKSGDAPREGWHQVRVVSGIKEFVDARVMKQKGRLVDGYRSWMYLNGAREGDSGCWSNLIWPTVAAHEFGHLWGLHDEYDEEAEWYMRPVLGFIEDSPPSIMNLSWFPGAVAKPRHFHAILENASKYDWIEEK